MERLNKKIKIETPRLLLRNLEESDVTSAYAEWLNDPVVSQYLSIFGQKQTEASCRKYVASFRDMKDGALIGIFYKEELQHIGNITIRYDEKKQSVGLGISIGVKKHWGKGLASEAVEAVCLACKKNKLKSIEAGVNPSNLASIKLFLTCGFSCKEKMVDGVRYLRFTRRIDTV